MIDFFSCIFFLNEGFYDLRICFIFIYAKQVEIEFPFYGYMELQRMHMHSTQTIVEMKEIDKCIKKAEIKAKNRR